MASISKFVFVAVMLIPGAAFGQGGGSGGGGSGGGSAGGGSAGGVSSAQPASACAASFLTALRCITFDCDRIAAATSILSCKRRRIWGTVRAAASD